MKVKNLFIILIIISTSFLLYACSASISSTVTFCTSTDKDLNPVGINTVFSSGTELQIVLNCNQKLNIDTLKFTVYKSQNDSGTEQIIDSQELNVSPKYHVITMPYTFSEVGKYRVEFTKSGTTIIGSGDVTISESSPPTENSSDVTKATTDTSSNIAVDLPSDSPTYSNSKYSYSISYPSDWSIKESDAGDGATLYDNGCAKVLVYAEDNVDGSSLDAYGVQNGFDIFKAQSMDEGNPSAAYLKNQDNLEEYKFITGKNDTFYVVYLSIDKTSSLYSDEAAANIAITVAQINHSLSIN